MLLIARLLDRLKLVRALATLALSSGMLVDLAASGFSVMTASTASKP